MSFDIDTLYHLLPSVHRQRDADQGAPLRALLAVIAEQTGVLEEDLEQLYDDLFIETCADWVVPYLGDLIGYRTLHGVVPRISSPRAEVANTIAYRRRKGTAAMLEQLARDVTGWNARVVEFFELLATTQYMNHLRPHNIAWADLRQWKSLERLNTPFDTMAHTADVRRIASGRGRHNIPNVGIFLWRLGAYRLQKTPAVPLNETDQRRYLFSPLGNNTRLFTKPETEGEITHLAELINVPMPIGRRSLAEDLSSLEGNYYGREKSLFLRVNDLDIDPSQIKVCNLQDAAGDTWAHAPPDGVYSIDPELGRIYLPADETFPARVSVTYHYGFSADMGGGTYERALSFDSVLAGAPVQTVPMPHDTIQAGIDALTSDGVVELNDNGRYPETPSLSLAAGQRVELRAHNEHRPTLVLDNEFVIRGNADAEVTLNGLLVCGGNSPDPADCLLRIPADSQLRRLRLRHCTFVPGMGLTNGGQPRHSERPSLIVDAPHVVVEIEDCIVGPLRIAEGAEVVIRHSILDATAAELVAYAAPEGSAHEAGGSLEIESSTVIGKIHALEMKLVSNSILLARKADSDTMPPIRARKKQAGCVRFSYVPRDARVPRRYRCQPDLAIEIAVEAARKEKPEIPESLLDELAHEISLRLRPMFTNLRYGQAAYGQLARSTPIEIRCGAEDEAEMGAFRGLYQPQRETNLRVRLDEYLRFGMEAGIFYAT